MKENPERDIDLAESDTRRTRQATMAVMCEERRRLLVVAYQCGPGMGSVSQIGWEWYEGLCRNHRVTLVTHPRNRAALHGAGAPLADSEIIEVDTEWFAGPLYRFAKRLFPKSEHSVFLIASLDYFVFDLCAFRQLRRRISAGARWDVLHRVTPVTLAAPTWLGRLGIPTILGPLNSGLSDPPGFSEILRAESTWLVRFRVFGRLLDALIGSSRRAARILTATAATLRGVSRAHLGRCVSMVENGVDLQRFCVTPWPEPPGKTMPLQVLFVGRLIPAKALTLLLQAVAGLKRRGMAIELTVIGDGPLRALWEAESARLDLGALVQFRGNLPANDVARAMQECHVFCLPSVRESGGAVLLEAMACARPVIAMNFGGPAELVDREVGELIDLVSPERAIEALQAALSAVVDCPDDWRQRGLAGRQRVEALHSWSAKIRQAETLYQDVICERVSS